MANVEREHKNNVFCIMYRDKGNLLSLYNAVNGTDYTDTEELVVVTLEHTILMRMHNDAAFVIDLRLNLYEQQSSVNPNIPLRDLYYVVEEYKKLKPSSTLYGRTAVKIPAPGFITFYNGVEKQPAEVLLKLSDLYEVQDGEPQLELVVRQININRGYNDDLLEKCESLRGYMTFVNKVRFKMEKGTVVERAVEEAVDECIREGVMAEFFREHRSEVIAVGIFEYNAEEHDRVIKAESEAEGLNKGLALGKAEGKAEAIIELLEDLGDVPEDLRSRITEQKDLDILRDWHKKAARAKSVKEFEDFVL